MFRVYGAVLEMPICLIHYLSRCWTEPAKEKHAERDPDFLLGKVLANQMCVIDHSCSRRALGLLACSGTYLRSACFNRIMGLTEEIQDVTELHSCSCWASLCRQYRLRRENLIYVLTITVARTVTLTLTVTIPYYGLY